jgi:hypothetical protein
VTGTGMPYGTRSNALLTVRTGGREHTEFAVTGVRRSGARPPGTAAAARRVQS